MDKIMAKKLKSGKIRARISAKKNRIKKQSLKRMNNVLKNNICKWDNPILYQTCIPVEKNDDMSFVTTMRRTLRACKDGLGIAAPQIGESKCVILWKSSLESMTVNTMINPIIVESDDSTTTMAEGCLSYPGFSAKIERSIKVKVKWMDEKWNEHTKTFKGRESIIVQHEIDHLSGVCAVGNAWKESVSEESVEEATILE